MKPAKAKRRSPPKSQLRELEKRYDLVMGAINESVYDWDIANNRFVTAGTMQRLLGVPRSRLTLSGWQKSIHPEDYPRFREATLAHLKGLTARFECDYRFRAGDGTWRWARTHGLATRDKSGRAVRMVGSTGDITELKRTEEALRRSEERYAIATRAATEGIYEWNVETGDLFISDRAREVFALPDRALKNTDWTQLIHPDDRERYRAAVIAHFKGRAAAVECEYRAQDRDGHYRWVLDRGQAVRGPHGRAIRLIGAETDITEAREALEQQTAAAEILKVISRSPTDVQPVFEAILDNASRLCSADFAGVFLFDGETLRNVAHRSASAQFAEALKRTRPEQTVIDLFRVKNVAWDEIPAKYTGICW